MWIKTCPHCNGTKSDGPENFKVPCLVCNATGAVPSNDPADEFNEIVIDDSGNEVVENVPPV